MTAGDEPLADVRDMYLVHTLLRREFTLMPALVRSVADGDTGRSEVIGAHIELLDTVLHHHHRGEDEHIWVRLLERAPAEVAPIVHLMEEQHRGIEGLNTKLNEALATWRGTGDPEARAALAEVLDRLVPRLTEHLAVEEAQALPIMAKHITGAEWGRMVAEGGSAIAPEHLPLLFGMSMYEGDPDVVSTAILHMPPEVQPTIGELAAQAFAAHSQRVHGTPTPPRIGEASGAVHRASPGGATTVAEPSDQRRRSDRNLPQPDGAHGCVVGS
ncbi:hemerythrin domain-containing protein [Micromonospora sp. URMC 103]|uniref:hemerythrin domain-containing protein n=1 Tax=Micromonospora sp. URMC 103 TaxID=3423406 RepID=UPI003F19A455